jgi:Brp/Blh family beta-carotene 15,15'-monooxygenase
MSVFHFGNADLKFLNLSDINIKLSWGFTMTFLPMLFNKDVVESIFYNLIAMKIPESITAVIYCVLILSIIRIYWTAIKIILKSNININWHKNKNILFLSELTVLVILSYFTHPFVWFAIYFCGLNGVRSLIDSKFNLNIDLKWIFLFT